MSNTKSKDKRDRDVELALRLHEKFNPLGVTENAVLPEHKNGDYAPRTLIDQTLEIIDPTPNIYTLFSQFDTRFFSNKLVSVEVKWSQRMTSCAGICTFHPRNRDCVISLSAPLLKLRPRKDLVETLLHEMIHGYLFLTNNNRDRDGHGPEFCKIMDRINKEAGTHITIYHSFHEEVKLYKQHWWRCDGPCQKQPPYFGMVRRAMNRAPGPSDFWWASHQGRCNGRFIKVREPEKKITRGKEKKVPRAANENKKPAEYVPNEKPNKKLDDWFESKGKKSNEAFIVPVKSSRSPATRPTNHLQPKISKPSAGGLVKLGTSTNNVHGWGTGGPGTSSSASFSPASNRIRSSNERTTGALNFAGKLGGSSTGRSKLLDKFPTPSVSNHGAKHETFDESPPSKKPRIVEPTRNVEVRFPSADSKGESYNCPVCNVPIGASRLNDHLDACLSNNTTSNGNDQSPCVITVTESPPGPWNRNAETSRPIVSTPLKGRATISHVVSPISNGDNFVFCPVCDKDVDITGLYEHLDQCSDSPRDNQQSSRQQTSNCKAQVMPKNKTDEVKVPLNESYVCLVCSAKISGDIALNDHLEECVKAIFNDDTFDVGNETIVDITSPKNLIVKDQTNSQFPCPVCMDLVQESLMNKHLDRCLAGQK